MLNCKYLEIAGTLAERIEGGRYSVFNKLPSETQLVREFGVSRQTIRDAIRELIRRKIVWRRQGSGTYIKRQKPNGGDLPKIGVIVTGGVFSRRFPLLSAELLRMAGGEGFDLLLENTVHGEPAEQPERLMAAFARMVREGVRGVLYQPLMMTRAHERLNRQLVAGINVPVVLVGGEIRACRGGRIYDTVDQDWFEAGRLLVQFLRRKGVRRLFFLSERQAGGSVERRLFGMKSMGGESAVRLVGGWRGAAEMLRRVERSPEVGAIVGQGGARMEELCACLLSRPLAARSLRLAVLGDCAEANLARKGVTVVRGSCLDVIREAFCRLLHRLKDPSVRPVSILLPPHLEIGETTTLIPENRG